jgi:hypothetical protein
MPSKIAVGWGAVVGWRAIQLALEMANQGKFDLTAKSPF